MEIQKTLDEAIEKLTSLRVELMKLDKDWLEEEASKIDLLLCKAHDQCALLVVVGQSEQLESVSTCMMCRKPKMDDGHTCCEECAGLAF